MNLLRRFAMVLLASSLLSSCDSLSGPDDVSAVAGTYILFSVDGQPVPIYEQGEWDIISGDLTLMADRRFTRTSNFRDLWDEPRPPHHSEGSFRLDGSKLRFSYPDGYSDGGIVSGDTVTIINDAKIRWVFVRGAP
jgi:hypothetical protein